MSFGIKYLRKKLQLRRIESFAYPEFQLAHQLIFGVKFLLLCSMKYHLVKPPILVTSIHASFPSTRYLGESMIQRSGASAHVAGVSKVLKLHRCHYG